MIKWASAIRIGLLCLTICVSPANRALSQRLVIPRMTSGGGNVIQVESLNGQAIKISYSFNYRKEEITINGTKLYPMKHDELLYSINSRELAINQSIYTIPLPGGRSEKRVDKKHTVNLRTSSNGALQSSLGGFVQQVTADTGIANKAGHAVTVIQSNSDALKNKAIQVENLAVGK